MEHGDWAQAVIEFTDRETAEQVAVECLHPELAGAQADGAITGWWFVRKTPYWRLRYLPMVNDVPHRLAHVLDVLAADDRIVGWTTGIYEPEVHAFGGSAAMRAAHDLFARDSLNILGYLGRQRAVPPGTPCLGRREVGILLCSVLMRGARQDWYEQGDVWAKVAQHRASAPSLPPSARARLKAALYKLMTVEAIPTGTPAGRDPLTAISDWSGAFQHAGEYLADLARHGELQRGLRAVLAHHVIFHWNRLGLSYAEQSTLAHLAKEIVMIEQESAAVAPETSADPTEVAVETQVVPTAERLRHALADQLRDKGTVRSERVDEAIRSVPRDIFVRRFEPSVSLEEAYADTPIYTKFNDSGVSVSAVSQPTVNGLMLELTDAQEDMRVAEIGAGSGLFAAYLGYLVGEKGQVFTVDVDQDLVDAARANLEAAGARNVTAILGDGALGHPEAAPYDRIVATVGAHGIPVAWLDQLAPDGRLIVPLRLRGTVSRAIAFERDADRPWRSVRSEMCTFMPLRGLADDARHIVALTPDGSVALQTHREQAVDEARLVGVLNKPITEAWTGVKFRGLESPEWMELWLACVMQGGLSRMPVEQSAIDRGLIKRPYPSSCAVVDRGDLAHLVRRPAERAPDGGQLYEFGVVGYGSGGDELAGRVADALRTWDRDYRSRTVRFEIQPLDAEPTESRPGRFAFDTPLNRIVIEWQ
ncbi:methyltransferase, FxLD system [Sphaerisporangium album]|uniref:Protein-L-isoaspartate O-methyltransferase n=1 Tax=Sphaerisporangium album TaxID=509200 RepID=A0A367EWD0_9ACTN|nr:methyltransferase, FxLD system [Sphaerisporangium album]RCG22456.1 methyltransferase, FxLD system [Sphaerisporangium album]